MAARLRAPHQAEVRAKIQSSQLINALTNHVFGKNDMKATQVNAALGLLRKSVPDLTNTTLTGPDGGAVQFSVIERKIVDAANPNG